MSAFQNLRENNIEFQDEFTEGLNDKEISAVLSQMKDIDADDLKKPKVDDIISKL